MPFPYFHILNVLLTVALVTIAYALVAMVRRPPTSSLRRKGYFPAIARTVTAVTAYCRATSR